MNGLITSVGLMVWAYASMRALYQAEEAKTWLGVFAAILGVSLINYFCYELILNSASLNDFKMTSADGVSTIGLLLLFGTFASAFVAIMRSIERLKEASLKNWWRWAKTDIAGETTMNRILRLVLRLFSATALLVITTGAAVFYFFPESPIEIGGRQFQLQDILGGWIIEMKNLDSGALGFAGFLIVLIAASLYFLLRRSSSRSPSNGSMTAVHSTSLCPHCGKYYAQTGTFCPHCGQIQDVVKAAVLSS